MVLQKNQKKIFCENSIITIIHGESILEYEAKKIYLNETRIVVGPLKNLKISIKNNKSQVLILHIANENNNFHRSKCGFVIQANYQY